MESTESINILKQQIFKEATNHKFLTKFQSLIDQIDQITNLIFGIEMKLERCSYNECNIINTEMWSSRQGNELRNLKTPLCMNLSLEIMKSCYDKQEDRRIYKFCTIEAANQRSSFFIGTLNIISSGVVYPQNSQKKLTLP